jgi:hypothetical protein
MEQSNVSKLSQFLSYIHERYVVQNLTIELWILLKF